DSPGNKYMSFSAGGDFVVRVRPSTTADHPIALVVRGDDGTFEQGPASSLEQRISASESVAHYRLTLRNYSHREITVLCSVVSVPAGSGDGIPTLVDTVATSNDYCTYQNKAPYVKTIDWTNEKIQQAMRAMGPSWRSMFSYSEWRVPYGLENDDDGTDDDKRD